MLRAEARAGGRCERGREYHCERNTEHIARSENALQGSRLGRRQPVLPTLQTASNSVGQPGGECASKQSVGCGFALLGSCARGSRVGGRLILPPGRRPDWKRLKRRTKVRGPHPGEHTSARSARGTSSKRGLVVCKAGLTPHMVKGVMPIQAAPPQVSITRGSGISERRGSAGRDQCRKRSLPQFRHMIGPPGGVPEPTGDRFH